MFYTFIPGGLFVLLIIIFKCAVFMLGECSLREEGKYQLALQTQTLIQKDSVFIHLCLCYDKKHPLHLKSPGGKTKSFRKVKRFEKQTLQIKFFFHLSTEITQPDIDTYTQN